MHELTKELLTLLDLIEITTEDEEIKALTRQRFDLGERHGYTVVITSELTSGEIN